jgi:hypothetical protein
VFVDTIIAAAGYAKPGDDNDAATVQKIMSALAGLSRPFAYRSDCPTLVAPGAVTKLTAMVEEASKQGE